MSLCWAVMGILRLDEGFFETVPDFPNAYNECLSAAFDMIKDPSYLARRAVAGVPAAGMGIWGNHEARRKTNYHE